MLTIAGVALLGASVLPAPAPSDARPSDRLPAEIADCGPGSLPETGLQGDVSARDRDSGRSARGYRCNVKLLGKYNGHGGGITSTSYENCAYMGTLFPGSMVGPDTGVAVVDASDPRAPRRTATLRAPALQAGTWESLKVNEKSKLLVGTGVPLLFGAGLLAVYDVSDCAHPRLLNRGGPGDASPLPITSHEGGFSPDGKTYWASGLALGHLSAVDLSEPSRTKVISTAITGMDAHGIGVSPDGNTLYLSHNVGGMSVWDVSAVQRRLPNPQIRKIGQVEWSDGGWATQHSSPVSYSGKNHLFTVLEGGSGGVKVLDVADRRTPRLVNNIKLEINLPEHQDKGIASSMGGSAFAYESHYCAADRPVDPTALACGWTSSGIRVFDVRNPRKVKEIAYYNPPAKTNKHLELWNSPHALASVLGVPLLSAPSILKSLSEGQFDPREALSPRTGKVALGDISTDWCFSPPEWRGNKLYVTCSDNGFQVLELSNGVYSPPADQKSTVGS